MSEYMSIFQIGPVQDFIQAARKAQDFWSGSFLLSYLNARAINAFNVNSNVIFPDVTDSSIYKAANNSIPWKKEMNLDCYVPSIPNRFLQ